MINTLGHLAMAPEETAILDKILARHAKDAGPLIPVLQDVQRQFGYLSRENLAYIARALKIPLSDVFGTASFYAQFYLAPRGENMVRVCQGTACHVQGSGGILAAFAAALGIDAGETTADGKFSLERVACVGSCGLAPVVMINQQTFGRLSPEDVPLLLAKLSMPLGEPQQKAHDQPQEDAP
ncbi:MAG: NADH-quinone oxidoreductase subunit NuoE [Firmicutes bacterium]|jgi:NADH:ubiquinone oxidoreductase subunit E|nr:NADH-quinone oxidoreductase subunit NuoE [Bacillota bacterium]